MNRIPVTVESEGAAGYMAVVRCACGRIYGFRPAADLTVALLVEAAAIPTRNCPCADQDATVNT